MFTEILTKIPETESYTEFMNDGKKFHKAATGGLNRREVFSAEILYNIFAMSIEKYFMGFLMYHKDLPYNHTFQDFADAAQRVTFVDKGLLEDLDYMGSFQEICSIDQYERKEPSENDIFKIAQICNRVKGFVMYNVPYS